MKQRGALQRLTEYLTVSQAAAFLGVSAATLRYWDRGGKVTARRHPVNGYRLYAEQELVQLLKRVEPPARPRRRGSGDARAMRGRR